ncbi:MAG: phosphonate ABC transporter substrate-binding protein [Telmatospirillum sp.]|nr:phosphonate ABC transporter substrate-binding protein [Telmatospirillum sp.]
MKTTRRQIIAGAAGAALFAPALAATRAQAQASWRAQFPTLNVAVIPSENQQTVMSRYTALQEYFAKSFGVQVRLFTATDYAGIIEAVKSKRVELAFFGPASYARAFEVTDGNVEPLVIEADINGVAAYRAVMIVRKDSPAQKIEDLRGKTLAFVDPNSTSGFVAPNFFLSKAGTPANTYFSRTGFAGSHDNVALAIVNGQYDAGFVWYRSATDSVFQRMWDKNLIAKDSVRVVWTSPDIPESPWAARKDLPQAMRDDLRKAMMDMPTNDPAGFRQITEGNSKGFVLGSHAVYEPIIEMIKFNQAQRRAS